MAYTSAIDNPEQEKFAQLVVGGMSYIEAHILCYSEEMSVATRRNRAKALARVPEVGTRIAQLRGPIVAKVRKKFEYSLDHALNECVEASNLAERLQEPATMLRATELKAKLVKLLGGETQRRDRELDGVSVEELLDLLTELRVRKQELGQRGELVEVEGRVEEPGADLV